MKNVKEIEVFYQNKRVGKLAEYNKYRTAFEYDAEWLDSGFSISPISLPLEKKLFISEYSPFKGLFGVFDDHLPDGWGRMMTDRYLRKKGIRPETITEMTRLTLLSSDSFGGLEFRPSQYESDNIENVDFDKIFREIKRITIDITEDNTIDDLFKRGGSSGGARPKLNAIIDGDMYLVKFPMSEDSLNMGKMEYDYLKVAKACGINIPEIRLIESKYTDGFLATKRFDRPRNNIRPHMISLGGLLETSHRIPTLDYMHLFQIGYILTKSEKCLEEIFRIMCFNFYANNMDDHGKNFSFMRYLDSNWQLTPAYDLTKSILPYGERSTTINGKGKDIKMDDLLSYANKFNLDRTKMKNIAIEIEERVNSNLKSYL